MQRITATDLPAAVQVIDLDAPPAADSLTLPDGRPYRSLIGVVRAEDRLLGTVQLPLDERGHVPGAALGDGLRRLGAAIPARVDGAGREPAVREPAVRERLSVVVATCADAGRVLRCVTSLLECGDGDLEVVVVENRPVRSDTRAALRERFGERDDLIFVEEPRPGLAVARNRGLAAASGQLVAFIDDDTLVDAQWAHTLRGAFADPAVACVTGLILPLRFETESQLLYEQLAALGKGLEPRSFHLSDRAQEGPLFPFAAGAFGSGANTALRAGVARVLGGFDEALGTGTAARGGEDLDMYVRILLGGHRLLYAPGAVVYHEHPDDRNGIRRRAFDYGIGLTAMLTRRALGGDGAAILRALPAGLRYLRNPQSRKNLARSRTYPRRLMLLECLGMFVGPFAAVVSMMQARSLAAASPAAPEPTGEPAAAPPAPVPARPEGFEPGATRALDLEQPLRDLDLGCAPCGAPYGTLFALLRLHGDTLAAMEVPLRDGRIEAQVLAEHVWGEAAGAIAHHVSVRGCRPGTDELGPRALLRGLGGACPGRRVDGRDVPFVSVIVPTARRPERIVKCLASLAALRYPWFEMVIVDNAPDDPRTREAVQAFAATDGRVRYLSEPLPGSSVARNRGIAEVDSDLLAFTDDDVEVDPEWLSWIVERFLADPRVDVVTGLVLPANLDTPEQRWFEEFSGFGKGFDVAYYDTDEHLVSDRPLYPYWGGVFGSGNNMAFRRHVLLEIGGFDPALGAGSPALAGADIESFSHAILRGSRLAYEPRALCWHDHRATPSAVSKQTFSYAVGVTAILTKWLLRDPRLWAHGLRQGAGLAAGALRRRSAPTASSRELTRLSLQLRMNRERGALRRQLAGFAVGPVLYARSLLWARRLRLREVLPAREGARA